MVKKNHLSLVEGIVGRCWRAGVTWEAERTVGNGSRQQVVLPGVLFFAYFWAGHFKCIALPCLNRVVLCVTEVGFTTKDEAVVQVSFVAIFRKHGFAIQLVPRAPLFSLAAALSLWPAHPSLSHLNYYKIRIGKGSPNISSCEQTINYSGIAYSCVGRRSCSPLPRAVSFALRSSANTLRGLCTVPCLHMLAKYPEVSQVQLCWAKWTHSEISSLLWDTFLPPQEHSPLVDKCNHPCFLQLPSSLTFPATQSLHLRLISGQSGSFSQPALAPLTMRQSRQRNGNVIKHQKVPRLCVDRFPPLVTSLK